MVLIRVKSNASFTTVGEDLFLGSASLGTNYNSTSSAQRYFLPFNTHKYDVLYQKDLILGAKNATGTSQYTANRIVKFYKRFKNRKEYIDASSGSVMNTSYRMIIFPVDCAMDANSLNVEVTGHTIFYYKDN
jgi:phosphoribosyl-AMP cyclohydrolase